MMVLARIGFALSVMLCAFGLWRYIDGRQPRGLQAGDTTLIAVYVLSRLSIWLLFSVFLQQHVTSSDPKLFYTAQLEHFLSGDVPVRDFYYPYGPLLLPSIAPFYVLLGRTLSGISLFAILSEAVALWFFVKAARIAEDLGHVSHAWIQDALALYLLNPATLYWTVLLGYHSIVQTTYSMVALYYLLRQRQTLGYCWGLLGLAGSKLLMVLDWPALFAVTQPNIRKLLLGALPLVGVYALYAAITKDVLFPVRYHFTYPSSEGNLWFLLTLLGDPGTLYPRSVGSILSLALFGALLLGGFAYWLWCLRRGWSAYSFPAAFGISTFTVGLFFVCSRYTGNYYVPILMLPACMVVTRPGAGKGPLWCVLLVSSLCIVGDAIWSAAFGQPATLIEAFSQQAYLAWLWTGTIIIRLVAFSVIARHGLHLAVSPQLVKL